MNTVASYSAWPGIRLLSRFLEAESMKMGSEELMIENPVSLTVLLDLLTSNFAHHVPLFQLVPLTIYP